MLTIPTSFSLHARSLCERKMGSIKFLWGEGFWVPNKEKGPRHVHSRAGVSPGKMTPAWEAPAKQGVSPSKVRCYHFQLHLLFAYRCTSHRGRRLHARCSLCRRRSATSAYVSLRACAVAGPRPIVGCGSWGGGVGTVTSHACSPSSGTRVRAQSEPMMRGLCFSTH